MCVYDGFTAVFHFPERSADFLQGIAIPRDESDDHRKAKGLFQRYEVATGSTRRRDGNARRLRHLEKDN